MDRRLVLGALASLGLAQGVGAGPRVGARLADAAEAIRAREAIPAMGLGVVDRGETVLVRGFGGAGERDRFRAASISKVFTAQAIMMLVEDGNLSLDDDVARWAPGFEDRDLTVRHLLTHRAGLRDAVFPVEIDDQARLAAYLRLLAAQAPAALPGAAYGYADAHYNLLGGVVSAASGESCAAFVQRRLIAPLRLAETSPFPPPVARQAIVPPTSSRPPRPFDIAFAPSEGLVTSARDLTAWVRATLRQDRRLLKPASFAAMITPQATTAAPGRAIGLGWQLREEAGRRIAEHAGSIRGYSALVLTYPDQRRGFVILTNADDAPRWEIARQLDSVLGAG